jgi:hypothetical protein
MIAANRLNEPIIEGTKELKYDGKLVWAKFAVPVIVLIIITGSVKHMLHDLLIWYARKCMWR